MRVRIMSCRAYPSSYLKVGNIYSAERASDGNWLVANGKGIRLLMFLHEIRFICPAVVRAE